jgi:hypothetical protein
VQQAFSNTSQCYLAISLIYIDCIHYDIIVSKCPSVYLHPNKDGFKGAPFDKANVGGKNVRLVSSQVAHFLIKRNAYVTGLKQ